MKKEFQKATGQARAKIFGGLDSNEQFDSSRRPQSLTPAEIIRMASDYNQALDRLRAEGKLQLAADLNYRAGKISQQENALDQARHFFKMSSDLLKECPWDEVSEQVWLVYLERARVEY